MIEISIIIPVYNNEKHICECIESVLNQTIIDKIEIICVNDGSTDNSKDLISKYSKVVLIEQPNLGSGPARNKGIKAANGRFLMFLDGDDFIPHNDSVECLYKAIIQTGVSICFGNMLRLDNGRIYRRFEHTRKFSHFSYEGPLSTDKFQYPFVHVLCIYEKAFLVNNGIYYMDKRRGQDVAFCAEALIKAKKVFHINKDVYVHRRGHKSLKYTYDKCKDYVDCWLAVIRMAKENGYIDYAKLAYDELRVFFAKAGYRIVSQEQEWTLVNIVNQELKDVDSKSRRLLEQKDWEKKTWPYYIEYLTVFMRRLLGYFERKLLYLFDRSCLEKR